jgi:hypothetical protein
MAFYESLRLEGALLAPPPADVPAATEASTAVVVAQIKDVATERVIGDLQTTGIHLRVVEVLSGELRPELGGKVIVEHPLGDPKVAEQQVNALRATLPKGEAVWFLRWQGDKAPVTKPGVFVNSDPAK